MRKNRTGLTLLVLLGLVAGMSGLVVASVPLYRMICEVTGLGGTTRVAERGEERRTSDVVVTVLFDANVNKGLPWRFAPAQREMKVKLGEEALAFFTATNLSDQPVTGTATFNVTPAKAGPYFNKIECFCFTEQRLEPGQTVEMPVSFFVDPAMLDNENANEVRTITLSYTFFRAKDDAGAKAPVSPQAKASTPQQANTN